MQRNTHRRRLHEVRRWAMLLLAVPLLSCSRGLQQRGDVEDGPVTIVVENRNFLDVTVYAVLGSGRVRLGQVTGSSSATFDVPLRRISASGDVRFNVDPIGSNRTWTSDALHLYAGQEVELIVESDVRRSPFSVRGN
jgi:hypothetical protein